MLVQYMLVLARSLKTGRTLPLVVVGVKAIGLAFVLAGRSGILTRDAIFKSRLAEYRDAVSWLARELPPQPLQAMSVPSRYEYLAMAVLAEKTDDGVVTAVFVIGGAFPAKHAVTFIAQLTTLTIGLMGTFSPKVRRVARDWFAF